MSTIHLPGYRGASTHVMVSEIEVVQSAVDDGRYNAVVITKSGAKYYTTDYPQDVLAKIAAAGKPTKVPNIPKTKVDVQDGYKPRGKK